MLADQQPISFAEGEPHVAHLEEQKAADNLVGRVQSPMAAVRGTGQPGSCEAKINKHCELQSPS